MSGGLGVAGGSWGAVPRDRSGAEQPAQHLPSCAGQPSGRAGPTVVDTAVEDLERALHRDRSHAVLVAAPGPQQAEVLHVLARRLASTLSVVLLTDPSVGPDEICSRILASWSRDPLAQAEPQLMWLVHELATKGSALVLLVSDASRMPAGTLRYLGRLAANSRGGLRLGLVAAIEGRRPADTVAELVSTLGCGVEKVVLDEARLGSEDSVFVHPPRVRIPAVERREDKGLSRPRASTRGVATASRRRSRPARWPRRATVSILGMAVAFFGFYQLPLLAASRGVAPEFEPEVPGYQAQPEVAPEVASEAAVPPDVVLALDAPASAPSEPLESESTGSIEPEALRADAAGAAASQPSRPEELSRPAVEPVRPMIAVSLNARPWARIEVDGRDVGITPLGDLRLPRGKHRFRAFLSDGRVVERVVPVDAYHDHISFY